MARPVDYELAVWEDDGGARERRRLEETRRTTGDESRPGDDSGIDEDAPRILPFVPRKIEPKRPA